MFSFTKPGITLRRVRRQNFEASITWDPSPASDITRSKEGEVMLKRTKGSREEDAWLSDEQLAQCARADEAQTYGSPIPTRIVSNGEYMPQPQSENQKRVESSIQELVNSASQK